MGITLALESAGLVPVWFKEPRSGPRNSLEDYGGLSASSL